jgi:DegV family protein with EDD domain
MSIRIVTDSTSDLPAEIAGRYQIEIIPNILNLDGQSFKDGEGMTREEFYARLPNLTNSPTTATASTGEYLALYDRIFQQGAEQIISIHPSASLSGIVNAASVAAQMSNKPVEVIDSGQVSLGLGFQVMAAAQAAQENCSFKEIIQLIHEVRYHTKLVAMLDSLEYVRRSGRVSWTKTHLAAFLDLKPIIELREGKVISLGEARTRKKGIRRLGDMLEKLGQVKHMVILHTNAQEEASQFQALYQHLSAQPTWTCNVTTIIGTHVGPRGLGFAVELN